MLIEIFFHFMLPFLAYIFYLYCSQFYYILYLEQELLPEDSISQKLRGLISMPNEFTNPDSTDLKISLKEILKDECLTQQSLKCSGIRQKASANAYTAHKICEVDILKK